MCKALHHRHLFDNTNPNAAVHVGLSEMQPGPQGLQLSGCHAIRVQDLMQLRFLLCLKSLATPEFYKAQGKACLFCCQRCVRLIEFSPAARPFGSTGSASVRLQLVEMSSFVTKAGEAMASRHLEEGWRKTSNESLAGNQTRSLSRCSSRSARLWALCTKTTG